MVPQLTVAARRLPFDEPGAQNALSSLQADLLASALRAAPGESDAERAVECWSGSRKLALERIDRLREEVASAGQIDLAMLSVATNELRTLV